MKLESILHKRHVVYSVKTMIQPVKIAAYRASLLLGHDRNGIWANQDHVSRFESPAGNLLPTECPGGNYCGTQIPVWMKGEDTRHTGFSFSKSVSLQNNMCFYKHNILPLNITCVTINITFVSIKITCVSQYITCVSLNVTCVSQYITCVSINITRVSLNVTCVSLYITCVSINITCFSQYIQYNTI